MPPAPRTATMVVAELTIHVTYKRMKTMTLRVRMPDAQVVVSAPIGTPVAVIHDFVTSKITWIRQHQQRITARAAHTTPDLRDEGTVRVWGKSLPLRIHTAQKNRLVQQPDAIELHLVPEHDHALRQAHIDLLYRRLVQHELPALIATWAPRMQVTVKKTFVQKMKTRWGSCNYRAHHIRLNSELASYPPQCLEYVVVHELVHLLEASHNQRFYALMTQFYPEWKTVRALLRGIPED